MKDPRRGDTDADDHALGLAVERWCAALDAAVAIPAHTAAGQQAKLRMIYTALWDAMKDEPVFGNREEFAPLTVLAELLGLDPAPSSATEAQAVPTDAPPDRMTSRRRWPRRKLPTMRCSTWSRRSSTCVRADIAIIARIATSERVVGPEVWRRIEDHLDLALATLEDTWTLAQERRHALRDALKTEQAAHKLLQRTRNVDVQPGSPADIEVAEAVWSFMQNISRMVLKRHDDAAAAA
jgi:hypothetical protein